MFKCFFKRFILTAIKVAVKNTKIKITTIKFKERANKKKEILYAMNCFTHKVKTNEVLMKVLFDSNVEINEVLMKVLFDSNVEINIINEKIIKMT